VLCQADPRLDLADADFIVGLLAAATDNGCAPPD
jgi:hypothetical protein